MNFKHLHYFWMAAKSGGVVKAGEQLHTTPQTLSGQIKLLEDRLGQPLFRKRGRALELTDAGRVALGYAEQIFSLGQELEHALRLDALQTKVLEFRVGVADSVNKAVAYRLLEPALALSMPVRLICSEGKYGELLSQLALNRLDLVLADEPMSRKLSVRAFNHPLGRSSTSFYAAPALQALLGDAFPQCLQGAPILIPGAQASLRAQLDAWLTRHQLDVRVVGEFDDGALMSAFGRQGRGVFMAPTAMESDTLAGGDVLLLGRSEELTEEFYAVSVERRITHPCVVAITDVARVRLA